MSEHVAPSRSPSMFRADGLWKTYGSVKALRPLTLTIDRGEAVAVIGPSGAGKTTLLHILGGVLAPDGGLLEVDGHPLADVTAREERSRLVGLIHQQYDLVPRLRVLHNVLAGRLGEWTLRRALLSLVRPRERDRALAALGRVGIADKANERTSRLSGGEQQRVALARLLLQDPAAILADEPVASLDPGRAVDVTNMLVGIARERGRTLVASLHAADLARRSFDRLIALKDGDVVFDRPASAVSDADLDDLYAIEGARETFARW